ncbi:RcnB family protein [Ideonella sp. A 288]|uniref:RcnB family protein n=1 Tax=Ideonella sp. A 288 TaxID=1962181 RepID=UPI000B4BEC64|nr:RcnB family protein [Ideonella sp. A 288]
MAFTRTLSAAVALTVAAAGLAFAQPQGRDDRPGRDDRGRGEQSRGNGPQDRRNDNANRPDRPQPGDRGNGWQRRDDRGVPPASGGRWEGRFDGQGRDGRRADRFDGPGRDGRWADRGMGPGANYRWADPGRGRDGSYYRGGRLPPQYNNRYYVVDDWRGHRLNAPPRGYHWVQAGGDYLLVAITTGIILELLLSN